MPVELIVILGVMIVIALTLKALKQPEPSKPEALFSPEFEQQRSPKPPHAASYPYVKRASLLTLNEQAFFKELHPLTAPHWHVFCQVRLEDGRLWRS